MVYELQVVYVETIKGSEFIKGVSSTRIKINSEFELEEILKDPCRIKTVKESMNHFPQGITARISRSELIRETLCMS
jgi:hypothetical protein